MLSFLLHLNFIKFVNFDSWMGQCPCFIRWFTWEFIVRGHPLKCTPWGYLTNIKLNSTSMTTMWKEWSQCIHMIKTYINQRQRSLKGDCPLVLRYWGAVHISYDFKTIFERYCYISQDTHDWIIEDFFKILLSYPE